MRLRVVLSIGLILVTSSFAAGQVPCGPTVTPPATLFVNWPQLQFDSAHSGCNPYESILSPNTVSNLAGKWVKLSLNGVYSSSVVANGLLYTAVYSQMDHERKAGAGIL